MLRDSFISINFSRIVITGLVVLLLFFFDMAYAKNTLGTIQFQVITTELKVSAQEIQSISLQKNKDDNYAVHLVLSKKMGDKFAKMTGGHIGEMLQLVVNGQVVSAAVVQNALGAAMLITVKTRAEAEAIVQSLHNKK